MDIENIKEQLIERVTALSNRNKRDATTLIGSEKIGELANRFTNMPDFANKIVEVLNDILQEQNIDFPSDDEKNEFIKDLQPTISKLMKGFIVD